MHIKRIPLAESCSGHLLKNRDVIMISKYLSGLKFGMLLQIAIGPMCLMVFNTAKNAGFKVAMALVLAIALVDAFYIMLAGIGVSRMLENDRVKKVFKIVGSLVLIVFGLNIILNVFGINIIPGMDLVPTSSNIFIQGLVMTLSNPLTIVFWGAVLTAKIIEDKMEKDELAVFSAGLVSATVFFMTAVAGLGTVLSGFIPKNVSDVLNVLVGLLIIYFGVKMYLKKT